MSVMSKKKVLLVFGTRPEAIKLAPVYHELKDCRADFEPVVSVTAQHRSMLDQVLELFDIVPKHDLNIMSDGQTLFDVSRNALRGLHNLYETEKPDIVLVQGDTTTAFIAALAAFYLKIPVGHVEAGLRTWDKYNPFPEETNRQLISVLTDFHFAPTEANRENLLKDGVPSERIWVTGNTVIDALYMVARKDMPLEGFGLDKVDFKKPIILVTVHRRETHGQHIEEICAAMAECATQRPELEIVYPVHPNPHIRLPVQEILGGIGNIHLVEPLPYGIFISLMKRAKLVLTDSGGVQEEAPSFGKPVLVLREATERNEAIEAGTVKIVGRRKSDILREVNTLLDDQDAYALMAQAANPYGDGHTSKRISSILREQLNGHQVT